MNHKETKRLDKNLKKLDELKGRQILLISTNEKQTKFVIYANNPINNTVAHYTINRLTKNYTTSSIQVCGETGVILFKSQKMFQESTDLKQMEVFQAYYDEESHIVIELCNGYTISLLFHEEV